MRPGGAKEEAISMEDNNTVKGKTTPSIPANYISILQLKERWIKGKEQKPKEEEEEEEKRRKQQAEEQQRIEEDLKKSEIKLKREDLDESRLIQSNQKHWRRNSKKDESNDGGEARWAEKEETSVIRSERGEDAAPRDEGLPEKKNRGFRRKRYDSKKKKRKNQEVAAVKEVECGSIAPPEYTVTEKNTPVKDQIQVDTKKGEKALGKKSVGSREKAVSDDADATAIETQFEDLSIKSGEERGDTKNLKAQTRRRSSNRSNHRHDLPRRCARMPIETATMVWVKKEQTERAGDGIGNSSSH